MENSRAQQAGREEASSWLIEGELSVRRLAVQIQADLTALESLCRRLDEDASRQKDCPPRSWLLDNWYLACEAGLRAKSVFRGRQRLPALNQEERVLRIQRVGRELARFETIDEQEICAFLSGIQEVEPLTEEELWRVPAALEAGLLTQLRETAEELERLLARGEHAQGLEPEMRMLFAHFRHLRSLSLEHTLEELSMVERLFRQDPSGVYPQMSDESRQIYRQTLCRLARHEKLSQQACAQQILDLARQHSDGQDHIGYYLFTAPLGAEKRLSQGSWYLSVLTLLTTALSVWAGFVLGRWWAIFLFLFPIFELVKNAADFILLRTIPPRPVFRLELKQGVPKEGKTLCVIAALLSTPESVDDLVSKLERYALANRSAGEQVRYGILADLPDRDTPIQEEDRKLLNRTRDRIEFLNRRYNGQFVLFFREPSYLETEKRYQGKERKRGAILQLTRFLRGRRTELQLLAGEEEGLQGIKFLLVLDGDTILTVNAVKDLVGTMLHPLNQPKLDPERRFVVRGYGILQPRVETELSSASASTFARLFGGLGGLDPYGGATSDIYHDLFDQASFLGKGLIHVETFGICMDGRFPENRILSHDLLEGSYLRTGWTSQVELMDSFPGTARSWLDRYHRWIRGDWQVLPWLLPKVRDEAGNRVENPISPLSKWKIIDNLRRSLTPPATLLALLLGILYGGPLFTAAALVALTSAASQLLYSTADLLYRHGKGSFRRYHSGLYAGLSGAVLRTLTQLLFLPVQSWTALSAVCTALWRMVVSRRHLLDWVTSDQSSRTRDRLSSICRRFWLSLLLGGLSMILARHPLGALLGIGWLLAPFLFWHWSKSQAGKTVVNEKDRAFLLHEATLIWRYYENWLRPDYHYLIPDNVQALPDKGAALRTSPTNIGLSLLCCLAALDLQLTFPSRASEWIVKQLETLEKLERWHGHLYNWYDLETAAPLAPRYVSTVDSGNLCGDLLALAQGLRELGEEDLARRAQRLADEMDFSLLYDAARHLFYVGYDVETAQYNSSHYDLMASEARMTSYLAVARGEVPHRHWRQLSRGLLQKGRYTGMASWTGTMFEYFMPQLLLPCYKDSLLSETLSFCLDQQRRRGRLAGVPWGISESAFYALDAQQNYQYKAHGVASLGLQRGLEGELVIAPYASFLALMAAPGPAIANLRRLRDLGAEGRYGLYEALDYTPARGGDRQNPLIVQSWMAHHLGMSLVALDNCLNCQIMQQRFFRNPEMAAYQELLQEKVPVGAPVLKPVPLDRPKERSGRAAKPWRRQGSGFDPSDPVWGILSNGGYSVFLSAGGQGASRSGESTLLHPDGIRLTVTDGEEDVQVFPRKETGEALTWDYSSGKAVLTWKGTAFTLTQEVLVDRLRNGESRVFTLTAKKELEGKLALMLRPVLSSWDSYAAHPAFSRMCIESRYIGSGVQFIRKPGRGKPQPVLTVLWEDLDVGWTTNRERYLTTGSLRHTGREGVVVDPCLALELPLSLRPSERLVFRLAIAAGDRENSLLTAQGLLALRRPTPAPLADRLSRSMLPGEITAAFVLLSRLLSPGPLGREGEVLGQQALWPFAISGDLPIVTLTLTESELGTGIALAREQDFLSRLGYTFDLVLLLPETGDYHQSIRRGLTEHLNDAGLTRLLDSSGGIHLVSGPRERWAPILGMAAVNLQPGDRMEQPDRFLPADTSVPAPPLPGKPIQWHWEEHRFILETHGSLPPLRWSHLLVSDRFGWRCDEAGTGHLWYRNAQMEQLTPWQNDPIAISGPEDLIYHWSDGQVSLFARQDGQNATVTYGPGYARWKKTAGGRSFTLTAFVPPEQAVRLFLFEVQGETPSDRLCWSFTPKLAHRDSHMPWVRWEGDSWGLRLTNPAGTMAGAHLILTASQPFAEWTVQQGRVELTLKTDEPLILAAAMETAEPHQSYLRMDAARQALKHTEEWWLRKTASLTVTTPDTALNHYLSFWGRYQVLAGRLFGRSGLYQCGGAFGFRDQLQDVLSLIPFAPELAREQILRAARHQFREGDVMHWWHPSSGQDGAQGVRTRISDDLLWLPYTLGRWTAETGDITLMQETSPYLEGRPLDEGEAERYEFCPPTQERDSLYRHSVQAIECVLNRGIGAHGLCLMGTGDWNDGMDRVGAEGRGESVWLTWFLALTLRTFLPLCQRMGEQDRAKRYEQLFQNLTQAAHRAWDGGWYLRAYDDDGNPIGSHRNRECAIDSISQSFAVLTPGPDPELSRQAVQAAADQLYDREHQMARLLWPPFQAASDPGYIRSYPGGLRENGGQYTHAACWLAMALLEAGEVETGTQLLHDLLPETHPWEVYLAEPFVLAGDVYAAPDQEGRGGWSWYTGSASWYCQAATQSLLGLRLQSGKLLIQPNLPASWPGYEAVWRGASYTLSIKVTQGIRPGLTLDGISQPDGIPLADLRGDHQAVLTLSTEKPIGKSGGEIGEKDV